LYIPVRIYLEGTERTYRPPGAHRNTVPDREYLKCTLHTRRSVVTYTALNQQNPQWVVNLKS